jgi:ribonuclease HI
MTNTLEVYVDGASRGNPGPSAVGIFIRDSKGKDLVKKGEFIGETTNNVAEYEALKRALYLLSKTKEFSNSTLRIYSDSELMVQQLTGNYKIKSQNLIPLAIQTRKLMNKFKKIEFKIIERKDNKIADKLANKSMNTMDDIDDLKVTVL